MMTLGNSSHFSHNSGVAWPGNDNKYSHFASPGIINTIFSHCNCNNTQCSLHHNGGWSTLQTDRDTERETKTVGVLYGHLVASYIMVISRKGVNYLISNYLYWQDRGL